MADLIKGKDEFKKNCEEATKFIESCFDENNENDGLTFDERLHQRIVELPAAVRNIVVAASGKFEENRGDIPEEECECETKDVPMKSGTLLKLARESKQLYLDKQRELKTEKARLRLETDWSKIIEGRPNPNDTDKKEWITFQTHELQEEVDDLKCESEYMWELWELEKIMLRKQ